MLSDALRVYEYIIKIYMYEPSEKFSEYSSHQQLKCGGCIAISHLHYSALKCAKCCTEGCLTDILWSYAHLLISFSHIQFGSELSSCYIMTDCILIWERCNIFPCILILLSQVKHSAQHTIFLQYTQHRLCLFYHSWYPPSCCGVSLYFLGEFRVKCFLTLRQSMLRLL